jgi:cytochrome P450
MDVLPFWKYVKQDTYRKFCSFHTLVGEICQMGIDRYLAQEDKASQSDSCVASHFFHLASEMSPEAKADIDLTDEVLFLGVCDVFRAGTESMTANMYWFVLYMSAFPEVQGRARQEVEDQCSDSFDNAHKLPYLQATVHEVYRFSSLAPFGKRTASDDVMLSDGTFIPKGTSVLLNFWALNRDSKHWEKPYTFNPDRFLKADGSFDGGKVDKMMPFGAGMRRCPGESSGKVLVPMLAAALLRNFTIEPPTGVTPDLEPLFGISLTPKPYNVVLKPRSS